MDAPDRHFSEVSTQHVCVCNFGSRSATIDYEPSKPIFDVSGARKTQHVAMLASPSLKNSRATLFATKGTPSNPIPILNESSLIQFEIQAILSIWLENELGGQL